ncbi:hypothetical protein RHSIM_Rhsim10G0115000 [Rhododendron simsii]|uniref:Uncharacterized protein n=1 Tax=Rhododendron simsii TaxID=118357 RepID=A0A834LE69_RHOSS|nr:hypothetical protein RHSIM_Rhsim10G0115000 [Rhododendron simsii]
MGITRAKPSPDGAVVRATELGSVPVIAEEIGLTLGEGPVATIEGGGDGGATVTPMDSTQSVEGFMVSTARDGAAAGGTPIEGGSVATVEENTGVIRMAECCTGEMEHRTVEEETRTVETTAGEGDTVIEEHRAGEEEYRTVEVSTGGGDTVMGEHRAVEEEHRTVEEPTEGGSMGFAASVPTTPASTPFTPAGSVIEMEIGGLDVSVERRAMEERGTPASATSSEFPFTPSDTPIETESRGGEDEDTEAAARRLARGKSVAGESDGQEVRDPLAAPLFRPPIGSSREQGVSLRDTLECADPRDLSARLAETPSLASVLSREETLREAEREEEERQRAREGPRVTLVQEVEAAARERAAFSEESYVPRVHFFVPFGVDAFVPRQALQEEQVLHDPGSHMGMSDPLVIFNAFYISCPFLKAFFNFLQVLWNLWSGLRANFLVRSREVTRSRVLLESPFGWQWYLREWVTRQSLGLTEFRVPVGVPLLMLRTGDYTREEIERHTRPVEDLTAYLSPSMDYAGYRERYLAYRLRMVERLSGATEMGGNESEVATGASGSRGSRRGGTNSRRRSGRGRGTGRVAEVGHTFPEVSRVVSVVTREGIEGEITIPSRSASITLPEAEVPRAWAENVYRLLLDCFTVIRQGAMGVSPEVLPCGATAAAQRGGARR